MSHCSLSSTSDRYRKTDGKHGHDWQATTALALTTTKRNSDAKPTTPPISQRHTDDNLTVASNGDSTPPG